MTKGTRMGVPKATIAILISLSALREKTCDSVLVDHRSSHISVYRETCFVLSILVFLVPSPEPGEWSILHNCLLNCIDYLLS